MPVSAISPGIFFRHFLEHLIETGHRNCGGAAVEPLDHTGYHSLSLVWLGCGSRAGSKSGRPTYVNWGRPWTASIAPLVGHVFIKATIRFPVVGNGVGRNLEGFASAGRCRNCSASPARVRRVFDGEEFLEYLVCFG